MRARLLRALFVVIALAGVVAWVLPWVLFVLRPFPGRLLATAVFAAIVSEKLWSSFLRMPAAAAVAPEGDWTASLVGLAYAAVTFAILADLDARRRGLAPSACTALGAVVYVAGIALKAAALRRLGAGWSIQLDKADTKGARLLREGPYRFVRHPLYLAAMLDTVGFALVFASPWGVGLAALAFCPAEIARARFEEVHLKAAFGIEYARYAEEVGGFVPRLRE
jgi:protein-S-isoprenylcysteine O-methyltransferase Ste14